MRRVLGVVREDVVQVVDPDGEAVLILLRTLSVISAPCWITIRRPRHLALMTKRAASWRVHGVSAARQLTFRPSAYDFSNVFTQSLKASRGLACTHEPCMS